MTHAYYNAMQSHFPKNNPFDPWITTYMLDYGKDCVAGC